jgi:hypothetical protein
MPSDMMRGKTETIVNSGKCSCGCGCGCNPKFAEKSGYKAGLKGGSTHALHHPEPSEKS